jgi:hypothetical protein
LFEIDCSCAVWPAKTLKNTKNPEKAKAEQQDIFRYICPVRRFLLVDNKPFAA